MLADDSKRSSREEYLKRYLSGSEGKEKTRKKKKAKHKDAGSRFALLL